MTALGGRSEPDRPRDCPWSWYPPPGETGTPGLGGGGAGGAGGATAAAPASPAPAAAGEDASAVDPRPGTGACSSERVITGPSAGWPSRTMQPLPTGTRETRSLPRNVPLVLPLSWRTQPVPSNCSTACCQDTRGSLTTMS